MADKIISKIEQFKNKSVLIIGDIMIDSYLWGNVERISPEAPVPIVSCVEREERLGGAANVALNIQALGATPYLCSVVGNDEKAEAVFNLLKNAKMSPSGIVIDKNRRTTVKFRVISQGQHLLRVDEESTDNLGSTVEKLFIKNIKTNIEENKIDIIIFEDYDKGVITEQVIKEVVSFAKNKNISTLVDPKKRNFDLYRGITLFKPNFKEFTEGLNLNIEKRDLGGLLKAGKKHLEKTGNSNLMITLSEVGICILSKEMCYHVDAERRDIVDVSGAGDTVISVAALAMSTNMDFADVAVISNLAGGLVCEKTGVVPVNIEKFKEEVIRFYKKPNIKIINY